MEQGILISCLDVQDIFEGIRAAHEIGYRNVEISACPDDTRPNLVNISEAQRQEARKLVDDLGMKISGLQCHIHNGYGDESETVRNAAVEHTKRMLGLSASIGVDLLHTVSGVAEDSAQHEEKMDRVAACYREILGEAGKDTLRVGMEPVFIYVIGNLAHTRSLYEKISGLPLYINYDPGHFPYHDESPLPFIGEYADKIIHAHGKDSTVEDLAPGEEVNEAEHVFKMPDGKRKFRFVPPGQGLLDWDEIYPALQKAGFDGVISLEMGHGYKGPGEIVARKGYEFFQARYGIM